MGKSLKNPKNQIHRKEGTAESKWTDIKERNRLER